jgi:hypothetical protein|tara:strand:+ start:465 stop:656 length:192 start_codon:yes stop_codon:yes gene_type:complete
MKMRYTREKTRVEKLKQIQEDYEKQKRENDVKQELQKQVKMTGKNVSMFLKFKLSVPCQGCHR